VKVPVTEDVYRTYKRAEWREAKQQEVRRDRENSFEFMCEHEFDGQAVIDQALVDEIVIDKLLLDELYAALAELAEDERRLIDALYFNDKSERALSKETGTPRKTLTYWHKKLLKKLFKIFEKNL
jgi:DNA-directed RNA polymerase specialized sigma subunit